MTGIKALISGSNEAAPPLLINSAMPIMSKAVTVHLLPLGLSDVGVFIR
jgi:hypothetical protein